MRCPWAVFPLICALACLVGQQTTAQSSGGPTDAKAQKTYGDAIEYLHKHATAQAFDEFKKADKQDGGHCVACQQEIVRLGIELQDWKAAETACVELVSEVRTKKDTALAHYRFASVLMAEAAAKKKNDLYAHAHDEMSQALAAGPNFPDAVLADGIILARLNQDEAAKAQFEQYVKMRPADDPDRQRALRYISEPELARARMAPPFAVTALDGHRVSLDDLKGKVLLIDFWATWCPSCREALPHMREIAKKFQGQPLVVLSVSLDEDEQKWKDFVAKNEMTWIQYRDGGFTGSISRMFDVKAIPQTFTIDADGILQDQHIGDASIEGKLKKLVAQANLQAEEKPAP